ncbi:MAG: hypothetical protein ACREGJ_02230 [Candidatus Saccharimonadales bacterium]
MGKALGAGVLVVFATWAAVITLAAALWMVIVTALELGVLVWVLWAIATTKANDIPRVLIALVTPALLTLFFGLISWEMGIAQGLTAWVENVEGLAAFAALTFLYLGVYGFSFVAPTWGAAVAVSEAKEGRMATFYWVGLVSAVAGLLSGGWGHLAWYVNTY